MDAFRAATYAKLGKDGEARTIIDNLVDTYPEFPVHDWLAKWLRIPNDLSITMDSLYHLGLPRPEER
jgi:hypothetical protein